MSNDPICPKDKWIAITLCSQGTEGGQCEFLQERTRLGPSPFAGDGRRAADGELT